MTPKMKSNSASCSDGNSPMECEARSRANSLSKTGMSSRANSFSENEVLKDFKIDNVKMSRKIPHQRIGRSSRTNSFSDNEQLKDFPAENGKASRINSYAGMGRSSRTNSFSESENSKDCSLEALKISRHSSRTSSFTDIEKLNDCQTESGKTSGKTSPTEIGRTSRTNSFGKTSRTNSLSDFDVKKRKTPEPCKANKISKEVSFNMDLNVYIEPRQKHSKRKEYNKEKILARRKAVSIVDRNSFEVLRVLSMYTSWRQAQMRKGREYEDFGDFLDRASPKLYEKFFIENANLF